MNALERLGAWCLDEGWIWFVILVLLSLATIACATVGKSVTLDAKEWECTRASTKGIDAICVEYQHRGGLK